MGYHVTILRSANGVELPIEWSEIEALADQFPGARLVRIPHISDPTDATFVVTRNGVEHCLWYTDGTLWAKTPDEHTLAVMLDIAAALCARVRGDELETYRSDGSSYFHPDDAAALRAAKEADARLRQKMQIWYYLRLAIGAILLAAAGLAMLR